MFKLIHKTTVKSVLLFITFLVAVFFTTSANATPANNSIDIDLPVNEASSIIEQFLKTTGYNVIRSEKKDGIVLSASQKSAKLDILLSVNSPVACIMKTYPDADGSKEFQKLVEYIREYQQKTSYKKPENIKKPLPQESKQANQNIVCINAVVSGQSIRLTGFVVDAAGLILCTAHYLGSNPEISIFTRSGKAIRGKLVKISKTSDLALIDCDMKFDSAVEIFKGKSILKDGQVITSQGCANGEYIRPIKGTVSGSPRKVDGQVLWQVKMKVEPGDSGSPVYTSQGDFAGVVRGRLRTTHDYGYIIPLDTVISFIKERQSK